MTPHALVARALNACRLVHKPTYVALRALVDHEVNRNRPDWATVSVLHKTQFREQWYYYRFKVLKELENGKDPRYRDFMIGSPTTILAEAYLLDLLSREASFQTSSRVFSYLWPRYAEAGRTFVFYQRGYVSRNSGIRAFFQSFPNNVALVTDIRHFYPSVTWNALEPRLNSRLAKVDSVPTKRVAHNLLGNLRQASPTGIPIGPELGHLLGNIALEDVDVAMEQQFGDRYFRYVDDIIVLCPPDMVESAYAKLEEQIRRIDLKFHPGKRDTVSADVWMKEMPEMSGRENAASFESFIDDLSSYLVVYPKRANVLREALVSEGFSLPIQRLTTQSRYAPYRRFVRKYGFRRLFGVLLKSERWFIDRARELRVRLHKELCEQREQDIPQSGMRRRWYVQKCRYRISRLLYLLDSTTYSDLMKSLPAGDEFGEYRALLGALQTGDVTGVLQMPGRVVATFCELADSHLEIKIKSKLPYAVDRAVAESVAALALHFSVDISNELLAPLFPGSRMLVNICRGGGQQEGDAIRRWSYLGESECLLRHLSRNEMRHLATTRLEEKEGIGLEGLLLGGGYLS